MKLYLGSRDYAPPGYLTVDIDAAHRPDIVADVTDLRQIADGDVEEICASHILEHLAWPTAFKALAEWTRILAKGGQLRLAVPDLGMLAAMVADGRNCWTAAGLIFGVGRLENPLEAHQFGYTQAMLRDMLRALGFGQFAWWKHDIPDASNGWMPVENGGRMAISLNLQARKLRPPVAPPGDLLAELMTDRMAPFDQVHARVVARRGSPADMTEGDPLLTQQLHMELIEARMRILHLEDELRRGSDRPG
ncbi:methyltransferase domain-containing protein [Roseomonas sp. AR75]|uniref:class I SAM-dependent methyltransferase n=1 Tax=Roseomonas sp. AR75 TaxID=2562311 RepID=UPI0010C08169|nr:methyltransferase domain-containing protein [Roseomonas sp. AR75]